MRDINKIITVGIFSTFFFSSLVLFKSPFEFYASYIVLLFLFPFFFGRFPFPTDVIKIFLPLILFGGISIYMGDNTIGQFLKIFLNVFFSAVFYQYVIQAYEFDVRKLTLYYMKGAYFVSLLGVIQVISLFVGFKWGYDYSWLLNKWSVHYGESGTIRLNSIFSEPSYFGGSIGPAFFIAFYNIFFNKTYFITRRQSIIIAIAYALTFSTVAYAGIFITFVLLLLNYGFVRYVAVFIPLLLISFAYLYASVPEFTHRIDGLVTLYSGEATSAFDVHGSSFVQYNNFHVAVENFKENPFLGTGLGSHVTAYERYSLTEKFGGIYDFNSQDANSMGLRLLSETGLFGILFVIIFIMKFFVHRQENTIKDEYWLISGAMLTIILLQLFRQGNYTYNGFMFFLWMYYYNFLENEEWEKRQKQIEQQETIF